jgi:tRNA-specific 2-thiouridylase
MSNKILVAMSGGVDSTIAAYKLKSAGNEVVGIHFRFWKWDGDDADYQKELKRLHQLADQIGIDFIEVEAQQMFKDRVIRKMLSQLKEGLTPNPCIHCNPSMKFDYLMAYASEQKAEFVATGHYVRAESKNGMKIGLYKAKDDSKDQSYFLCLLNQDILQKCKFPLGKTLKNENVHLADQLGFSFEDKPESQDLCFLTNASYAKFINAEFPKIMRPGDIQNLSGKVIGRHHGLPNYTIGQRKGIEIAANQPYYVLSKDPTTNVLVVGSKDDLKFNSMIVSGINWIAGSPPYNLSCKAKIRYRSPDFDCKLTKIDETSYHVDFSHGIRDITPGQYAVFYQDDELLGGGMIQQMEKIHV